MAWRVISLAMEGVGLGMLEAAVSVSNKQLEQTTGSVTGAF